MNPSLLSFRRIGERNSFNWVVEEKERGKGSYVKRVSKCLCLAKNLNPPRSRIKRNIELSRKIFSDI